MVHLIIYVILDSENILVFYFLCLLNYSSAFPVPKIYCPLWFTGGSPGGFIPLLYFHFSDIFGKSGGKCVFNLLCIAEFIMLYIRL